jgi:hypothetical protein
MKKLIKHFIATVSAGIFCFSLYAQTGATADPMKNPGTVDLDKHPEVMARVLGNVKNGKINFVPKGESIDTSLDLSKHPEIVQAIIKNPSNWPIILKAYNNRNDTLTQLGKNKQVIRDIMAVLISRHIIKERSEISNFLLNDDAFVLNGKKLPGSLYQELKERYIKAPGYVVYYGNSEMKGNGIFVRADTF